MPKTSLQIQYLNTRDKLTDIWDRFDTTVPDDEKPRYRQMMFEYLIDMFKSWAENGDSLPLAETMYFWARMREKFEKGQS